MCGLRPAGLDRRGEVWEFRPAGHKTEHHGKLRVIHLGRQAQAVLGAYLEGRPPEVRCFTPAESETARLAGRHAARTTPLSCGNRPETNRTGRRGRPPGERYTVASYRRAVARACDKAGVPRWAPNRLRHARATELRRLFGVEAARVVLGHSKVSTTELYAERDFAEARRIMGEVG